VNNKILTSINAAEEIVAKAENIDDNVRAQLVATLREAKTPLDSDKTIYRVAVWGLSLAMLMSIGGGVLLAFKGLEVPPLLVAAASGCIGAIGALFAKSRSDS
jgi:hypothetical protein